MPPTITRSRSNSRIRPGTGWLNASTLPQPVRNVASHRAGVPFDAGAIVGQADEPMRTLQVRATIP